MNLQIDIKQQDVGISLGCAHERSIVLRCHSQDEKIVWLNDLTKFVQHDANSSMPISYRAIAASKKDSEVNEGLIYICPLIRNIDGQFDNQANIQTPSHS